MKFVIKGKSLKEMSSRFHAISNLLGEATLYITPDGWKIHEMDPANVAMVGYEIKRDAFVQYDPGDAE